MIKGDEINKKHFTKKKIGTILGDWGRGRPHHVTKLAQKQQSSRALELLVGKLSSVLCLAGHS